MNEPGHDTISTGNIRILIVDDHDEMRKALRNLLSLSQGIRVIGEATNGQEGLTKATELEPDVIIMDEKMPILNGLEASRLISNSSLSSKVIMLTNYHTFSSEAFDCGVKAYLVKGVKLDILIDCIRRVHNGETIPSNS